MISDLTGMRFGRLTVLREAESRICGQQKYRYWECQCDCGNIIEVRGTSLTSKTRPTRSCGCLTVDKTKERNINLIGQRFGKLVVIQKIDAPKKTKEQHKWLCQCDCGETVICTTSSLTRGERTMCEKETEMLRREKVSKKAKERYQNLRIKTITSHGKSELNLFDVLVVNDLYQKNQSKEIPFVIYKITDLENGMVYIGKTMNLKRRIVQHLTAPDEKMLNINKAMRAKGADLFRFEAIDCAYTEYEAKKKEFEWIDFYKDNSYNVADRYSYNNIPVYQVDMSGNIVNSFQSIEEAQRTTKIYNISSALNRPDRQIGGYKWISQDNTEVTNQIAKG